MIGQTNQLLKELEIFEKYSKLNSIGEYTLHLLGDHSFHLLKDSSKETKIDLWINALTHGNEVGGLQGVNLFLNELSKCKAVPRSHLFVSLGNVQAFLQNKRFLETDLNRSYLVEKPGSLEEKQAELLLPIIKNTNYVFDLHQTTSESLTHFFIYTFNQNSYRFVSSISSNSPQLIYTSDNSYAGSGTTLTKAVMQYGMGGATIELGEKGFDIKQANLAKQFCLSALNAITSNFKDSKEVNLDHLYEVSYTFANPDRGGTLLPGLKNFSDVSKGQVLGENKGEEIVSPFTGKILFPKYGENQKTSHELFRIVTKLKTLPKS